MINQNLTTLYKDLLKKNELIASGKLYNSLAVDLSTTSDSIIVNVIALPYITYLNNDYNLTKQFISNPIFENEIGNLLYQDTEQVVNDILNGVTPTITEKQIIVKYNGK